MKITATISNAHLDALSVIASEVCPYADGRDWGSVFEEFIEDYLLRERGRLGRVVNGKYKTINQK